MKIFAILLLVLVGLFIIFKTVQEALLNSINDTNNY